MILLFETIAQLESSALRRTWLTEHYPCFDPALVEQLQQEAHHWERDDSRKPFLIAQLLADAAELWDDRRTLAASLRIEAQSLRGIEPLTALGKYEEAVRIYQSLGLEEQAADAAIGQVATLRALGRYTDAFTTNCRIIDYFRMTNHSYGLARALLNHGLVSYYLGQFAQARILYAEAHDLFSALGERQWCAAIESNDANVLEELNDYSAAEEQYRKARAYYLEAGMANAVARIDHNLGYLHFSLGNYQHALRLFARARDQFLQQESAIDVAFVDLYRSEIYAVFNLWRKMLEVARTARPIFERAQMPWETAQLLLNEVIALINLQRSELALVQLGQARRLFVQSGFTHWLALADLYEGYLHLRNRDYDGAIRLAQQARTRYLQYGLARRVGHCETLLGQAALAGGDLTKAAHHFDEAMRCAGPAGSPLVTYHYHLGLARVYQMQRDVPAAEDHYQQAITAIERVQAKIGAEDYKVAFLGDKLAVYEQFIQLCLEQNDPAYARKAFETLERAKLNIVRVFDQHTPMDSAETQNEADHRENGTAPLDASEERTQLRQLKRQLNRYYTQFYTPDAAFTSEADAMRLHSAIVQCEQRLSNLLDTRRRLDYAGDAQRLPHFPALPRLQATLPAGTLLLEYFFAANHLTIFCIDREMFVVHRVPIAIEQLQDLVQQFNFQISKFHLGTRFRERHRRLLQEGIDRILQQFYQLLIAPVTRLLDRADHLLIVPHQLLHNLPFHAFYDGQRYLIERCGVSCAISATFQAMMAHQPSPAHYGPPLILGVNDHHIQQAESEAVALARIFPAAELYCGDAATADRLVSIEQPRTFLHLATHGIFRADNPLFSALKLADGWLTVQELAALRHSAPLITLSACDTGRSESPFGNPLTDFYRTLFRTGARTLVVSLWSLDDQAAIRTMMSFYEELRKGQPVYQALRNAQLQMMTHWRHPYYWAPFVLIGDPDLHHLPASSAMDNQSEQSSHVELHP